MAAGSERKREVLGAADSFRRGGENPRSRSDTAWTRSSRGFFGLPSRSSRKAMRSRHVCIRSVACDLAQWTETQAVSSRAISASNSKRNWAASSSGSRVSTPTQSFPRALQRKKNLPGELVNDKLASCGTEQLFRCLCPSGFFGLPL
jgi:hypothetical protein